MDPIKLIYDPAGHTLTIWFDDPEKEDVCEETAEELVLMKDSGGRVIGVELLGYHPRGKGGALAVETVVLGEAG
ncbi:MAG: DUF2283 domain-containing protein [Planctomycetes bacterium]|jgi:uncharacterized protein YuzE|nr:DUF2283 domain-containing protein [Planctomycetota bacterium]